MLRFLHWRWAWPLRCSSPSKSRCLILGLLAFLSSDLQEQGQSTGRSQAGWVDCLEAKSATHPGMCFFLKLGHDLRSVDLSHAASLHRLIWLLRLRVENCENSGNRIKLEGWSVQVNWWCAWFLPVWAYLRLPFCDQGYSAEAKTWQGLLKPGSFQSEGEADVWGI